MRGQQAPNKGSEKKIRNEITEEQKREIKDAYVPFEETGIAPNDLKLAMKALGFDPKNEEVGKFWNRLEIKERTLMDLRTLLS